MKKFAVLFCLVVLSAALFAGTARAADNFDADITVVQALDMISFDPVGTSDLSNAYVTYEIYSRLFSFDAQLKPIKELCKDYKIVSDTEWHFTIWENVENHDGTILTADDVVYSLNRTKAGTAIGALFTPVREITKVDDYTISITTDGPYPSLNAALSHTATCIIPKHYSEKADADKDWSRPVGSGRYKFVSRMIGDNVKLERFDNYFNKDDIAKNKTLTFQIIPEGTNRTIAVETGKADLNLEFVANDYDRVIGHPDLKLWEGPSMTVWHLGMDNQAEWLSNKLVRQAVNFAIDHDACMQVGHNGKGEAFYNSATFAPQCLGAVNNPLDKYSYDPEKAQALMDEAGCPGFDTQIVVFRDEAERIATVIQAYLSVININVEIVKIENAVFASYIQDHKAPMFVTSWGCYWDPDMFLARRFSKAGIGGVNRVWYLNPDLDKLIVEGRSTFEEETRAGIYKKVQEFMAEEVPEVDLYASLIYGLSNTKLKGVSLSGERAYKLYNLHY
ncbi:MAG: ABC transporter substrate-binding protein [Synergistaceae bacterium]|nr:ABC transporter substrate-binding protein [Synergistaceae bacterium]